MNYTEKYHLPQWEMADRIMMEDFNRMCLDIEDGLDKTARDAAGDSNSVAETAAQASASAAADAAKAQDAADKAQTTADEALAMANKAFCPGYEPFVVGSYTATASGVITVDVGFAPSAVIIAGEIISGSQYEGNAFMAGKGIPTACITCTESGFTVNTIGVFNAPLINRDGHTYSYIAFR